MKSRLTIVGAVLLALIAVGTLAFLISPTANWRGYPRYRYFCPGNDFMLRINEVACVCRGCDPLDILNGVKTLEPYGFDPGLGGRPTSGCRELISAYPPWEYAFMMPLAAFSPRGAWGVYVVFMFGCMAALWYLSRRIAGPFVATFSLLLAIYPVWSNFFAGNFAVPILTAVFLMAYCLNRGHDALAGVCWSVAMVKPQLGLLFAVPLLWRKKFTTCFVAAGICLMASCLPAWLCSTSPLKMIFMAPTANTGAFTGSGTMPWCCCGVLDRNSEILVGCLIGLVVCVAMTWCLRRERDWLLFLMPAAVCAPNWTYTQSCSFALGWFFFFAVLRDVDRGENPVASGMFLVAAVPIFSRVYVASANLIGFCRFPPFVSHDMNLTIDSLNSTASILLAAAYCLWKLHRRTGEMPSTAVIS